MRVAGQIASVAGVLIVAVTICACGGNRPLVPVRELLDTLDQADRRPAGASFDVAPITVQGETHRAVAPPGVSRITWELHLPDRAVLQLLVAVKEDAWAIEGDGVLFRVGIGEGRTHEDLVTRLVNPFAQPEDRKWIPLTIDLGPYSGFKWSLFYHPRDLLWRIVLNTNAGLPGSTDNRGDMPLWGEPRVLHQ